MKSPEDVYRRFIEFEEEAASIYLQLASHFLQDADLSSFWLDMALQEKQHAGLLQFCLQDRSFASEIPGIAQIQKLEAFFKELGKRAADPRITVREAFSLAVAMETSEINSIYCHLTATLHSSMYLFRRKIATSLPSHIDDLVKAAQKYGIEAGAIQKLIRLEEDCSPHWQPPSR